MWFWHRNEPEHAQLWRHIIIVCLCVHLMVLYCLLFVYKGYDELHVHAQHMPFSLAQVVVRPLQKVIALPRVQKVSRATNTHEHRASLPAGTPSAHATSLRTAVTVKKKKRAVLPAKKKEMIVKDSVQRPPEPRQQEQAPIVTPDTKVALKVPEHVEDAHTVVIGREQAQALMVQETLCEEIKQKWRPAGGLPKSLVCDVRVCVGWDGAAHTIVFDKKSGVLIFDVHARSVVGSLTFPKVVWGKELVIHFDNVMG